MANHKMKSKKLHQAGIKNKEKSCVRRTFEIISGINYPSKALINDKAFIFAVGIGETVNTQQLRDIAGLPEYLHQIANYNAIEGTFSKLTSSTIHLYNPYVIELIIFELRYHQTTVRNTLQISQF